MAPLKALSGSDDATRILARLTRGVEPHALGTLGGDGGRIGGSGGDGGGGSGGGGDGDGGGGDGDGNGGGEDGTGEGGDGDGDGIAGGGDGGGGDGEGGGGDGDGGGGSALQYSAQKNHTKTVREPFLLPLYRHFWGLLFGVAVGGCCLG